MKLRVNATYRTREGNLLKIVGKDNHFRWPYDAEDGSSYTPDGFLYDRSDPSRYDLVERVVVSKQAAKNTADAEVPTLQLEDGKSYWTRDGLNVVRIKRRSPCFVSYPWEAEKVDGEGRIIEGGLQWWTDTGRYYAGNTDYKWDLVRECEPVISVDKKERTELFTKIREDLDTLIAHMAELERKLDAQDD